MTGISKTLREQVAKMQEGELFDLAELVLTELHNQIHQAWVENYEGDPDPDADHLEAAARSIQGAIDDVAEALDHAERFPT